MPVYLVIEITIKDRELYSKYVQKVPAIIKRILDSSFAVFCWCAAIAGRS
jgi:hypothetical protein